MKDEEKQIEEMAKIINDRLIEANNVLGSMNKGEDYWIAQKLVEHYEPKLPEDSVVLSKEEYEKLKSLYDTQKGAIMTSSIGDLPLTVEGLRKAVDEITRVNRVETELQELNIKYYNEAKDLRRKLKEAQEFWKATVRTEQEARKETAEKFADLLFSHITTCEVWEELRALWLNIGGGKKANLHIWNLLIEPVAKQFGVEIKE